MGSLLRPLHPEGGQQAVEGDLWLLPAVHDGLEDVWRQQDAAEVGTFDLLGLGEFGELGIFAGVQPPLLPMGTVYDVETRAPIVKDQVVADRSSRMDLDVNEEGSVTPYIGPDEPAAGKVNWLPTVPGKAWFPCFRFYSPTEAYFNRSWILPDIEKAQ